MNNPWGVVRALRLGLGRDMNPFRFPTPLFDMIISNLELYDNLHYTEGSMVKPPIGHDLSGVISRAHFSNVVVKRDAMFSEINVPGNFLVLSNVSYLAAKFEDNYGWDGTYYGWVDDVQPVSDSDAPVTRIRWHVDPWRTFAHKAVYASGIVTRSFRPNVNIPQPYNPAYWRITNVTSLILGFPNYTNMAWVHVQYVKEEGTTTVLETISFPVNRNGEGLNLRIPSDVGSAFSITPSLFVVASGRLEEALELPASSIVGAYMSLIPPVTYTGTGAMTDPIEVTSEGVSTALIGDYAVIRCPKASYPMIDTGWHYAVKADDTHRVIMTGYYGERLFEMPWGMEMDSIHLRTIIGGTTAYTFVSLGNPKLKTAEGMVFQVPMCPITITSNSWSEYVYSGQRDAEIEQRRIQADLSLHQSNLSAATNAVNSLIGGAVGGAMAGGAVGAVGGAVLSGVTSYATSRYAAESTYQYMTGPYNDAMVNMSDALQSRQVDNIILGGTGSDIAYSGFDITMSVLTYDVDSLAIRNDDIALYGYHTKEATTDCTHAVLSGEATRILNLDVSGEIPLYARNYIRNAYAQGVVQQ